MGPKRLRDGDTMIAAPLGAEGVGAAAPVRSKSAPAAPTAYQIQRGMW